MSQVTFFPLGILFAMLGAIFVKKKLKVSAILTAIEKEGAVTF